MTAPSTASIRRSLRSMYPKKPTTRRNGIVWRQDGFPVMQSVLQPGEHGTASVSHFTVSEADAKSYNLGLIFTAGTGQMMIEPGKYVRLHIGEQRASNLMMSDTPMERRTNWAIKDKARGRVLIAGLGIGMILHPLLDPQRATRKVNKWDRPDPAVDHVLVVEHNADVIALVAPSLARYGDRITIVQGDIFTFDPGREKFDTVYFDIWPEINQDNLPQMAKLHQRWKSRLNRGGDQKPWMSSWMVDHLRAERDSERRNSWW